jgi:hypothetical protein
MWPSSVKIRYTELKLLCGNLCGRPPAIPNHIIRPVLRRAYKNRISGIMVSMLSSSVVDRGFDPQSGKTKDSKLCICCFSTKYTVVRRKSKDWLAQNQDNVSEWGNMSTCGLLFQ